MIDFLKINESRKARHPVDLDETPVFMWPSAVFGGSPRRLILRKVPILILKMGTFPQDQL
jgi:hypothetical protein